MQIPVTCTGVLRHEDGRLMARGVRLTMQVDHKELGNAQFGVYDDPGFGRRYTGDEFVFYPDEPSHTGVASEDHRSLWHLRSAGD